MTATQIPQSIKANIHQDAINRVPGFFNATTQDIMNELFQNARRAGATLVSVTTTGELITVADNGPGIQDPGVILSFGQTQWDNNPTQNEHPAGMGLYSLARNQRVNIISKTQDNPPWQVILTPDHFVGKLSAPVKTLRDEGIPIGTSLTFIHEKESGNSPESVTEKAARYYPVAVNLNGKKIHQADFLAGALHVQEHEGVRIGVFRNRHHSNSINFHGILVKNNNLSETINTINSTWAAEIDVRDCPHLELTLPARKEIIQTPFIKKLHDPCREAVYKAISLETEEVEVSKEMQDDAARFGIKLPDAQPKLKLWHPKKADWITDKSHLEERTQVHPKSIICEVHLETHDQQALARAASFDGTAARFVQPDSRFQGYDWYDQLTRLTGVRTTITVGGEEIDLKEHRNEQNTLANHRPEKILFDLTLKHADKTNTSIQIISDLAFKTDETEYLYDDNAVLVTQDSGINTSQLQRILMDSFFSAELDGTMDSYDTQKEHCEEEFQGIAITLLSTEEEATKAALADAISSARYSIPNGLTATIRTTNRGEIEVTLETTPQDQG